MPLGEKSHGRLFASRARVPTGEHKFDQLCAELGIEHRLTKPRTPQTNGMVERFNGRISDVLQSHHFVSGEDLAQTLYRYVLLYNQQLPQSTLGSKTPLDAMQRWYASHPHLFVKRPCNLAGCDTYVAPKTAASPGWFNVTMDGHDEAVAVNPYTAAVIRAVDKEDTVFA